MFHNFIGLIYQFVTT